MDEPFGSLDAMTREEMNVGLLKIWAEEKKTILFVTHSIPEAAFLSDRVVVLTKRPSIVDSIFEIPFGRPRALDLMYTDAFGKVQAEIRNRIGFGKNS
jgi:NitT/TauT family transport system ATP-binding protein